MKDFIMLILFLALFVLSFCMIHAIAKKLEVTPSHMNQKRISFAIFISVVFFILLPSCVSMTLQVHENIFNVSMRTETLAHIWAIVTFFSVVLPFNVVLLSNPTKKGLGMTITKTVIMLIVSIFLLSLLQVKFPLLEKDLKELSAWEEISAPLMGFWLSYLVASWTWASWPTEEREVLEITE